MFGKVLSTMGGFFGDWLGGGMISTVMRFAGRTLGNYLERSSNDPEEYYHTKYHLDNLYINTNTNGKTIALVFGKARVAGHIIWATPIEEIAANSTDLRYFKNTNHIRTIHHNTDYVYYANFAMALCEGVVSEINRIWINGVEADLSEYKWRFYKGCEDQMPDPLIEKSFGPGITPAHRGLAYIVFEKLPLADFGGRIPGFSFEVTRKPTSPDYVGLEENIQHMVMIPGSGEFVYDNMCQDKIIYTMHDNIELYREPINHHNSENIANSLYSLNALQTACKNLKWVAPVVTWFTDSLDAGEASVFPAVEYHDPSSRTTEKWQVAGFTRNTAREISKGEFDIPNYGGTVNDASLIRYLKEVKNRKLKIMFYPMIFVDMPGKPWRGHMSGMPDGIRKFFNQAGGYKEFILHYANLVKDRVDAFVIGSEMKSLTKVREGDKYPAVEELIDLARKVKAILGPKVRVTYAADWSEYHHTDGGFYNLDALWACEAIDVVGIDAYFPLTNSTNSDISIDAIKEGWKSGEGYDYYIDHETGQQYPLAPEWAWKNIQYWWENSHINADGTTTKWVPESKKIWFTEFGFPSIDKAPNQPNIFFDPNCQDGGVPRYSNGEVDFAIQRKAIKATLEVWKKSKCVEKMFLWTWDARPYPAWPHGNIWADGAMWLRGHWVNGKIGTSNSAAILMELCKRGGVDSSKVHVETIDETISGMVITKQSSIWDVINLLRLVYFFDVRSCYLDRIDFIKRNSYGPIVINFGHLVKQNQEILEIVDIAQEDTLSEMVINFPDEAHAYYYNMVRNAVEMESNRQIYYLNLPIIMDEMTARNLASRIIYSSRLEDKIFKFTLTMEYLFKIHPGDIVLLNIYNHQYKIRVIDVKYHKLLVDIIGVFNYEGEYYKNSILVPEVKISIKQEEYLSLFELPESLNKRYKGSFYAAASQKTTLYAMPDETKIADLKASPMGIIRLAKNNAHADSRVIDEVSKFTLFSQSNFSSDRKMVPAMIGEELIYFNKVIKLKENLYEISSLVRGAGQTKIISHNIGERLICIDNACEISVDENLEDTNLTFLAMSRRESLYFRAMNKKSIQITKPSVERKANDLELKWQGRVKNIDVWKEAKYDIEYKILVESAGKVEEFLTKNNIFSLKGISADSKVAIVAIQRGFTESEKLYVLE